MPRGANGEGVVKNDQFMGFGRQNPGVGTRRDVSCGDAGIVLNGGPHGVSIVSQSDCGDPAWVGNTAEIDGVVLDCDIVSGVIGSVELPVQPSCSCHVHDFLVGSSVAIWTLVWKHLWGKQLHRGGFTRRED